MHLVELWDCDLLIHLLVKHPSGVVFTNQVGGVACRHPRCEGILLPITHVPDLHTRPGDPLLDFYESTLCPITLQQRIEWIDKWLVWSGLDDLFLARGDEELAEAWIPVVVRPELADEQHPLLGCFAGAQAIITYMNSD